MATKKQIVNRLKRARGQLDSLINALDSGEAECREVLTQFAAVNSAISRASYLTVACVMAQCTIDDANGADEVASSEGTEATAELGAKPGAERVEKQNDSSTPFTKNDHITVEELEKLFLSLA